MSSGSTRWVEDRFSAKDMRQHMKSRNDRRSDGAKG
jgi:hypothetical protein